MVRAWRGLAGQGKSRLGWAGRGEARQGSAGRGNARQGLYMRQEFSKKVKVQAVMRSGGHCESCGRKLLHVGDFKFEADHEIPDALNGPATLENCKVLCKSCHSTKTKNDVKIIAKAKRNYEKNYGIKRKRSIMPGSRDSLFRKKLNGRVERRDKVD